MFALAAHLTLTLTLGAGDLTPTKAAQVAKDRDAALAEIDKKYGNRKSSELSQDERREMIREQRAAEDAVLKKNGVEAKEMARYEAKMSLADRAATKSERERLDKKEADEKKAAQAKQPAGEVQVQRGFSDQNPVVLEEKAGQGAPTVEKGLPPDAVTDQAEASGTPAMEPDLGKPSKGGRAKK